MTGKLHIKIKKLHEDAIIPKYAKAGDAGLDLTSVVSNISPNGYVEHKTGLAVEIPDGYVGLLFPRSSISKLDMTLANSVGVIDSGYRGEICLRFKRASNGKGMYKVGDKVGQLVIIPYPKVELEEVTELDDTERGSGGFGSSGE